MELPQRTEASRLGEVGVGIFTSSVVELLGWLFRRTPQEADFGIDGYIDVVNTDGSVSGQSLAVQIKCGESYLNNGDSANVRYRGKNKHLNYLLNNPVPVIIALVHPTTKVCLWQLLDPSLIYKSGGSWSINVPRLSILSVTSKEALLEACGEPLDFVEKLQNNWMVNDLIANEFESVLYTIDRGDVEALSTFDTVNFFRSLASNKSQALRSRGKVELMVHGYDDDPRELWQIPEVRSFFQKLQDEVPSWFFFIKATGLHRSLTLIVSCVCSTDRINENQVRIDPHEMAAFIEHGFNRLNILTETLRLDESVNKEMSEYVGRYLTGNYA